ncbi:hypothetical protein V6N13_025253 [Hibiscus sabdariffa]
MTKAPFNGKGERASDLLGLIHSDVCRPMNTQARGGFQYFITFTDDFSRYGYIYLMRHKSEALEKFKEFKNEVQNQHGKSIKAFPSDRGGEYLSQDFDELLKECGIVSQLTPPGTPQWNGVSERRNPTLLDMVRSMMSHSDLLIYFWGHALETAAFTLNRVPSKSVQKTPYEIWTGKRPNQDEPKTYQEAVSSPDSEKWLEAMRSEMDSMSNNQVWTLVEPPEGIKSIGCKWVFKKKTDMDGNVHTYKGRLVAKGFQQIHGIDYDETFSPVAMFKFIRILLAIAAFHDYEIWQMDVKTAFLNGKLEEDVYMTKPEGFVTPENAGKKSSKQDTIADSTAEAEYIAASEVTKEAVWIKKFITELGVVPSISDAMELYCDNNGAITQAKEPRSHQRPKHILRASISYERS